MTKRSRNVCPTGSRTLLKIFIARRDRYHRLEFASAFGAVGLARDGLLDAGSYSRFSHRHSSPDALWSEWTYSVRQGTCVHALATQRRDKCQDTGSRFVGAVPTYRPDWIVQGYAGIATGAFWDSCWWLRVGTVHACPLVPHSLSYSASHRHFTTFGLWSRVGYRSARGAVANCVGIC